MYRSTKVLILLAVIASLAICAVPASATAWNAYSDFSTVTASGARWTYGFVHLTTVPDSYLIMPPGYSLPTWLDDQPGFRWLLNSTSTNGNGDPAPMIGVYTGTSNYWIFPAQSLCIGTDQDSNYATILRWTAPSAGTYSYSGSMTAVNGGTHNARFWIVKHTTGGSYQVLDSLAVLAGGTTRPIAGGLTMGAGDNLDIIVDSEANITWMRPYVKVDLTVTDFENPGVKGYVEDAQGGRIADAVVSNGTQSVITNFDGTYEMVISTPGTYTITAAMPSYTTASASVTVGTSGMVTQNFTLQAGNTISGTVIANSGSVPLSGVSVVTSDGVYATTTNSAGYYSIAVTPGVYNVGYSKSGFSPKVDTVDASAGSVTHNVGLNIAWDLANDFSTTSNPSGAWTLGYLDAAGVYSPCTKVGDLYDARAFSWARDWAAFGVTATKNVTVLPFQLNDFLSNPYMEGGKVALMAGQPESALATYGSWATGHLWDNNSAVARFTAPGSGPFTVTARFGAASTTADTYVPVALRYKPVGSSTYTYWVGESTSPRGSNMTFVDGFQGRAVNGYTDSVGTTPVVNYSTTLNLAAGDVIEALVGFNAQTVTDSSGALNAAFTRNLGRWAQTDLTISIPANYATIAGTVRASNRAGNPPIADVTVTATSGGQSYSGVTDATGVYFISLPAGSYTLTAANVSYATGSASTTVAAGATQVVNFNLVGNFANTVGQIKGFADGAGVVVTTPVQLACGTKGLWNDIFSFDKKFGAYTTITDSSGNQVQTTVKEYSFYVQSDDRVSGLKCIIPAALYPSITPYGPDYKITFTGVLGTDANGTRYITISSIDSAVQNANAAKPAPLGKSSKGLSKSGTFVKVWGKVTQHVVNPIANSPEEQLEGAPGWDYEYIVINDGGVDVKIPMHVQDHMFPISFMGTFAIGHYVSVKGIAGTTNGTDLAVFPLQHTDVLDYTAAGL
jgi:hypothetical protein